MDALAGVFPEGVWSSFGGTCEYDDANFMAQLLGMCTFSTDIDTDSILGADQSCYLPSNGSSFDIPDMSGSSVASKGISDPYLNGLYDNGLSVLLSGSSSPGFASDSSSVLMDYSILQESSNGNMVMNSTGIMNQEISQLDFPSSVANGVEHSPIGDGIFSVGVRKRARSPEHVHEDKLGRPKLARRFDFTSQIQEEANVTSVNALSSSPCTSRDDVSGATCSSLSVKENTNTDNILAQSPKGKARASRGSATDPQSLYARKRREKINERLRILQNLVPNGTKVDISTMLEEAVHYVKFLRLQIQLLSSDELWMYAPIAYNGTVDIAYINKIANGKLL